MSYRRPSRSAHGPEPRLPACPPHLHGEARKEWSRLGRKLRDFGLVTDIDKAALALYCQAWARWIEAEDALRNFGVVLKSPSGFPIQSPYLAIANKAMDQMTRLLAEFGMSPSSRARVTVQPPREQLATQAQPPSADERDPREYLRALS
jgi:P27 family predicted phage terminase small subunit